MSDVCICGRFDKGVETSRGQVIKTRMVYESLRAEIGEDNITTIDLYGGAAAMPRILRSYGGLFAIAKNYYNASVSRT